MSTSGTYLRAYTGDELLDEAWERIGLDPRKLEDRHVRSALRSMHDMLTDWTNAGLNLWQVDRQTVSVVAATATVTTPAGTTDILEAYVTSSGFDLALAPISRDEWMALPNKLESGRPTTYWSERINAVPVIHLWPVPDATYSLTYSRIRLPQDVTALGQTLDVPALWYDAMSAELASRLAAKFAFERVQYCEGKAKEAFAKAAVENRERVSLVLTPAL